MQWLIVGRLTRTRSITAWKVSKYGFFSGPNTPNTGKCGPEKTTFL